MTYLTVTGLLRREPQVFQSFADFERNSGFPQLAPSDRELRFDELRALPALRHGADWLLQPFREHLSKTHYALETSDPHVWVSLTVANSSSPVQPRIVLLKTYLAYGGNVAQFNPAFINRLPEDRSPAELRFEHEVLPRFLSRSWYWRALDWRREPVDDVYMGTTPVELPAAWGWGSIDWQMEDLGRAYVQRVLSRYRRYFGEENWLSDDKKLKSLSVFLDSGCTRYPWRKPGHQILVHCGRSDGRLFHVINRDFENLREIKPDLAQEAMDNYFVAALFGRPHEFEFTPYSVPVF